ncbi:MAG: aminoacetone oxidase family FAD-binding enzyme [Bacilli bacterium]
MKKVAIVGAGPSGMLAGIKIKESLGDKVNVVIYEKKDRVGKKILASGNGRCNLSNTDLDMSYYNNAFVNNIIKEINSTNLRCYFQELGLITMPDSSGRIYPITDMASTVLDILLRKISELQIEVKTNTLVTNINKENDKYILTTNNELHPFDIVILATGGKSSSYLGSNGEGYALAKELGAKITPLKPGLVGLKTTKDSIKGLNGIRQKVNLKLFNDKDECIFTENGEVQFKEDGISGIVVMNASRVIERTNEDYKLYLDLLPSLTKDDIQIFFDMHVELALAECLEGILPKMMAKLIMEKAKSFKKAINLIKNYPIEITGDYGFDRSQVTLGGVSLDCINRSLNLKIIRMYIYVENS